MASQALLEQQLADLKARLIILQEKYEKLTEETPDYIPNQAAIIEARALNRDQIKPLIAQIDQTTTELNDLLQVAPVEEVIQTDRKIKDKPIVSDIGNDTPAPELIEATEIDTKIPPTPGIRTDPITSAIGDNVPNPDVIQATELDTSIPLPYVPGIRTDPIKSDITNVTSVSGLQGVKDLTLTLPTIQDTNNAKTTDDWRVRLSLAANAPYLYNAKPAGILEYLKATNGVVFPYLPQIQISYAANYETSDIVHSNYKMIQYKSSSVDQITITGDFTAQDTYEANYMLAVIHFFKAVTKMFYGKDQIPKPGTPPPLCYLSGLGDFQFDKHPLVISSFNYNLPNDVDYIRASSPTLMPGVDSTAYNAKGSSQTSQQGRMGQGNTPLNPGAIESPPKFTNQATNTQPTYVPTKMSITITAYPIVTRNDISNRFSVRDYATGVLLQGSKNRGGGIW
jgi:hypothetical protein